MIAPAREQSCMAAADRSGGPVPGSGNVSGFGWQKRHAGVALLGGADSALGNLCSVSAELTGAIRCGRGYNGAYVE